MIDIGSTKYKKHECIQKGDNDKGKHRPLLEQEVNVIHRAMKNKINKGHSNDWRTKTGVSPLNLVRGLTMALSPTFLSKSAYGNGLTAATPWLVSSWSMKKKSSIKNKSYPSMENRKILSLSSLKKNTLWSANQSLLNLNSLKYSTAAATPSSNYTMRT